MDSKQVVNREFVQRRGDMVLMPGQHGDDGRWNSWTAEATLRTAFSAAPLGCPRSRPSKEKQGANQESRQGPHVGQAGHSGQVLDAKVVVTSAALAAQSAAWKMTFEPTVGSKKVRPPWVIVQRAWDETVMTLSFSKTTAATLLGWSLARLKRKLGLDTDQVTQLAKTLSVANTGPCQVMVQRLVARWAASPESVAEFFVPPMVLVKNSAVCISEALCKSLPAFTIDAIRKMARLDVQWVGLIYVRDGLAANGLLLSMHQAALPSNVFLIDVTCVIHGVYIPLKYLLALGNHASSLFCAGRLLCVPEQVRRLTRAILTILQRELRFRKVGPVGTQAKRASEAEPRAHFHRLVLEMTLLRESLLTRSAVSYGRALPPTKPRHWDTVAAAARALTTVFNDDWLSDEIWHTCSATCRCRNRDDAVQKAAAAITQSLLSRLPRTLAMSKWTTVQDNVQW